MQQFMLNETENSAINASLAVESQKVKAQYQLGLPVTQSWSHPHNQQIFHNNETL